MNARYTLERIEQLRTQAYNPARLIALAIGVAVLVVASIPAPLEYRVALIASALVLLAFALRGYLLPAQLVNAYDKAHAHWDRLLDVSDPRTNLVAGTRLRANEVAYYAEMSTRFGDNGAGAAGVPGSFVDPGAIVGARARFGANGVVVYGRRRTSKRRIPPPNTKRVAPMDSGRLAITNQRVIFAGERESIEVWLEPGMNCVPIEGSERIRIDGAGRSASESFTVDPALFALSMIRRARDVRLTIPAPPPPLASDQAFTDDPRVASGERMIS